MRTHSAACAGPKPPHEQGSIANGTTEEAIRFQISNLDDHTDASIFELEQHVDKEMSELEVRMTKQIQQSHKDYTAKLDEWSRVLFDKVEGGIEN